MKGITTVENECSILENLRESGNKDCWYHLKEILGSSVWTWVIPMGNLYCLILFNLVYIFVAISADDYYKGYLFLSYRHEDYEETVNYYRNYLKNYVAGKMQVDQ